MFNGLTLETPGIQECFEIFITNSLLRFLSDIIHTALVCSLHTISVDYVNLL